MIATGYPYGQKTEVIDLTNPKSKCELLADTSPQWGSVGGFVQNQPLICGGFDGRNVIQGDQIFFKSFNS